MGQESGVMSKKRLSREQRADLRAIYPPLWSELTSRKNTYYQLVTVLSGTLVGLFYAGFQISPVFYAATPPIFVLLSVSLSSYLVWRRELIMCLAEIERQLEIPSQCAYSVSDAVRMEHSVLPPFIRARSVVVVLVVSVIVMIMLEYLIFTTLVP
jgi:hypothetical protein